MLAVLSVIRTDWRPDIVVSKAWNLMPRCEHSTRPARKLLDVHAIDDCEFLMAHHFSAPVEGKASP